MRAQSLGERRAPTALGRALIMTLCLMALRPGLGRLLSLLLPQADPAGYYARLILQEALLWGLPALGLRPWRRKAKGSASPGGWAVWPCAGAFLLGLAAQGALMSLTSWWADATGAELSRVLLPQSQAQRLLAALALVIVPAVTEEAYFRGGLLGALQEQAAPWAALGASAGVFALMHGSLAGLPAHLAVSLVCTLLVMRWGLVRVSVCFHLGYNAAALVLAGLPWSGWCSLALGLLLTAGTLALAGEISWQSRGRRMTVADRWLLALTLLGAAGVYLPRW